MFRIRIVPIQRWDIIVGSYSGIVAVYDEGVLLRLESAKEAIRSVSQAVRMIRRHGGEACTAEWHLWIPEYNHPPIEMFPRYVDFIKENGEGLDFTLIAKSL